MRCTRDAENALDSQGPLMGLGGEKKVALSKRFKRHLHGRKVLECEYGRGADKGAERARVNQDGYHDVGTA
jgi:hypothetical protein